MRKIYILNAFSLNMLDRDEQRGAPEFYSPSGNETNINGVARWPRPIADAADVLNDIRYWAEKGHCEIISAVGHETTAKIFEKTLGIPVPYNRATVKLERGDWALIGQYVGPRLEEGATELPEGARIEWWAI